MLGLPSSQAEVFYRDWRAINAEYLVIGRVSWRYQMRVDYELFDVLRQTRSLPVVSPARPVRRGCWPTGCRCDL